MNHPVRHMQALFEAPGPYAVERGVALDLYRFSTEIVGEYTGPIVLSEVLSAGLPEHFASPINPIRIRLNEAAPHAFLLTSRRIINRNPGFVTNGVNTNYFKAGKIISSECVVTVDPDESFENIVGTAVHELGHSFGCPHCPDTSCMMFWLQDDRTKDLSNPFCDDCAEDLARAGFNESRLLAGL